LAIIIDKDISRYELDVYRTDLGLIYRYKFVQYNIMVHNYVFFLHYCLHDNRWIRWVIERQSGYGSKVSVKYIDNDSIVIDYKPPKEWYEQIVNSYANPNTFQIEEIFRCVPLEMEGSIAKLE